MFLWKICYKQCYDISSIPVGTNILHHLFNVIVTNTVIFLSVETINIPEYSSIWNYNTCIVLLTCCFCIGPCIDSRSAVLVPRPVGQRANTADRESIQGQYDMKFVTLLLNNPEQSIMVGPYGQSVWKEVATAGQYGILVFPCFNTGQYEKNLLTGLNSRINSAF